MLGFKRSANQTLKDSEKLEKKQKTSTDSVPLKTTLALTFPNEPHDSPLNLFKQGDLVYGSYAPRDVILNALLKKGFTYVCANHLNYNVINLMPNFDKVIDKVIALPEPEFNHFMFLYTYFNYLNREPGKPLPRQKNEPKFGAAIRRACKMLLINREGKRIVHVLTKSIDWKRVCSKERPNGEKDLSVTHSEFRAAYRDHCLYGTNPYLFFYDANNKLMKQPPWEDPDIAPHFKNYDELRKNKKKM